MAIEFTRLQDPPPGFRFERAGADLAISGDGRLLAQLGYSRMVYDDGTAVYGDFPQMLLWYLDATGSRYETGPQIDDAGAGSPVASVQMSAAGDFLVLGTTAPGLVVYRRTGGPGGWTRGPDSAVRCPGPAVFDPAGTSLAVCGTWQGDSGIAAFDQVTGATRMVAAPPAQFSDWTAAAWNPADPSLLAAVVTGGYVCVFRHTGGTLEVADVITPSLNTTALAWHPSGQWLLANRFYDDWADQDYYGAMIPDAYAWPGLQRIHTFKELAEAGSLRFDRSGKLLAAGMTYTPEPGSGFVCGVAMPVGLIVSAIGGGPASGGITAEVVLRPAGDGVQVSGAQVALGTDESGLLHLAAATGPDRWAAVNLANPWWGADPWPVQAPAFTVYTAQMGAASILYQKQPDGTYTLVGSGERQLSIMMPDGSRRTWPGSGFPLYQKQATGTWRKVIG